MNFGPRVPADLSKVQIIKKVEEVGERMNRVVISGGEELITGLRLSLTE